MRLSEITIRDLIALESVGAKVHSHRSPLGKLRLFISNVSVARNNIELLPTHLQGLIMHPLNLDKEVITLIGVTTNDKN